MAKSVGLSQTMPLSRGLPGPTEKRKRRRPSSPRRLDRHDAIALPTCFYVTKATCCHLGIMFCCNSADALLQRPPPVRPRTPAQATQRGCAAPYSTNEKSPNRGNVAASVISTRRRGAVVLGPDENIYRHAVQSEVGDNEDATPALPEGGVRPPHGRARPRPKVVARHSSGENRRDRSGVSLVERQKALCREIKTLGLRHDWRGALRTLR